MAGRLPGDLVDEARLTLDSVGRIELPPRCGRSSAATWLASTVPSARTMQQRCVPLSTICTVLG